VTAITEEELRRAIGATLVAHGKVEATMAQPIARRVLEYFGHEDTVLDNKLSSEDRDRFYQLEEEGLLTSEEEDATVSRGKTWRIHYWLLKKDRIRTVGRHVDAPPQSDDGSVYRGMDDKDWSRSSSAAKAPPAP
jgi:hypothetical protein